MYYLNYISLFTLICSINSLYFHIGETEKKCFIEEIPEDTVVVGNYKVEIFDKSQNKFIPTTSGLGMHVEVKDPEESVMLSRSISFTPTTGKYYVDIFNKYLNAYIPSPLSQGMFVLVTDPNGEVILARTYAAEGRFTFTSHNSGEHGLCLHSNSSSWFGGGQLRVHLDIQVGENAVDYQQVAAKDKLTELQVRLRQLLDQVEMITKEQNYQRYREERFKMTSESTNQRVLWWAVIQTSVLMCTGLWQMKHLKSFFIAKKLV